MIFSNDFEGDAPRSDLLVIRPFTFPAVFVTPGSQLSLFATVKNQGEGPSAPSTLHFYRSEDSLITIEDSVVGSIQADSLPPGGKALKPVLPH